MVAHRGLLHHAPENTLSNFRACLELKIGFEFDVARTKDGQLVCIHDDTVDRTTNGTGKVKELTLHEIRRLDAGTWFDPKFRGEKVPSVEEVIELVANSRAPNVLIAVDLKAEGVEGDVVALGERFQVLDQLLFIGRAITEPHVRRNLRERSALAQAAAVANNPEEFQAALKANDASWVYFRYMPSQEECDAVRRTRKRSFLAGATVAGLQASNWRTGIERNIDGILTDYSLELTSLLRGKTP